MKTKQYPKHVSLDAWTESAEGTDYRGKCNGCEETIGEEWGSTIGCEDAVWFYPYWEVNEATRLCDLCYAELLAGPATDTQSGDAQ